MKYVPGVYKAVSPMTVRDAMSINARCVDGLVVQPDELMHIVDIIEDGGHVYGELNTANFVILKFGSSAVSVVLVDELKEGDDDLPKEPIDLFAEFVGEPLMESLLEGELNTIQAVFDATPDEMLAIHGIGPASLDKIGEAKEQVLATGFILQVEEEETLTDEE